MELYDPSIHGDITPLTPEEEEQERLRSSQVEAQPSAPGSVPSGVELYDPSVHGEITPVDDRNMISKAWDAVRPYTIVPMAQKVGDYISGPDNWGNRAFDWVVENAPGMVQDAAVGAVYEGPRRFLEKGADIGNEVEENTVGPALDWVGNQIGKATDAVGITTPEGRKEYFERAERIKEENNLDNPARALLPEYEGESEFATDVGATLGPAIAGAAVTGGAGLAAGAGPWVVQGLRSIGAGLGFTATNEPGKNRTVIGEDALISLFPGLDEMDEEGRTQHLNVLFNDLMDAVGTAAAGDQIFNGVGKVFGLASEGIVKPAYALLSRNADEIAKTQMYKLLGALNLARGAKTPNERARLMEDAAEIVLENARKNIGGGASVKRDTMSAVEEGFIDIDPKVSSAARDVRSGHLGSGFDHKTREVVSDPSLKTQEYSRRTEDLLGGSEAVDAGGEGIQRQAMSEKEEILDSVRLAEADVSEAKALVDDLLSSDEAVRDTFTKLQKTDLNIDRARYKTVAQMREGVREAHKNMSAKKQELFDAIQDPGPKDLSKEFGWVADDPSLPEDIKRMIISDTVDGAVEVSKSPKELYARVIPAITNHLDNIYLHNGTGNATPLLKLRDDIHKVVGDLPGAEKFKNYYKKQWAPVWNSEHFGKFAAARKAYDPKLPVDFRANADKIMEDMLSNVHYSEQLHHFLKSPTGGQMSNAVPDYYMAQLAKNVQKSMNRSGKLDAVELNEMLAPLEQFAAMIEKTDKKKFTQLNSFVERFRSGKLDVESLEKIVQETQKQADESIKVLFNSKYKEFFDSQVQPLTGAKFQSFDELLRSKDASGRIPQILERAKATGNQEIIDGMKVAYLQHIRGRLFSDRKFIGTQRQMTIPSMTGRDVTKTLDPKHTSKEAADFLTDDSLDIQKIGRTIFEDSPETMDVVDTLVRESDRISSSISHATAKKVVNFNDLVNQGSAALDKVITLTMGVLNRMAARSRAAKGAAVQWLDPRDQAKEIFDNIMANPEEFARVARLLAESERQKSSPEFRTAVRSMFLLNGLDGDTADQETEAAFSSGVFDDAADAQTRTLFGDISDATKTVAAPINNRLKQDNTQNLDWLTAPLSGKSDRLGE